MNPQREPRTTDDLEPVPLKDRKRMLLSSPSASSKGLNVKQVIPDSFQVYPVHEAPANAESNFFFIEWPGLPRGVKFDPSDEELLWHLVAEVGKGMAKRHPFISEFIISLDEDHGFGNIHPQFLPGVKQDGSMSYFFHRRTVEVYKSQTKRQKKRSYYVDFSWHKICKTKPVFVDGIHQGSKEVMALYMIPLNGGNPEKTHWLMHQYHIATNGTEENLVVSKIFCEMMSKQGTHELCTNFLECFVAEDAGLGSPLPVTSEFQEERLHLESFSAEALTQVVDHDSGFEAIAGNLGCLKFTSSQKNYLTLEKSNANVDQHLEGAIAADGLPQLESSCDAAAELSISSACAKSEIIVKDQRESFVERRTFTVGFPLELRTMQSGFLRNLSAHRNNTNVFNCYRVRDDNMCYADGAHISLENSCAEKAPGHGSPKNVVDQMFKSQDRFMAASSSKINTSGMHSSAAHKSLDCLDTDPKCSGKDYISQGGNPTTEHRIRHGNAIIHSVVLALPALNNKGNSLEESKPNNLSKKNSTNWLNASALSVLPIKIEPESLEGTEVNVASEKISSGSEPNSDKNSTNWLSSSAISILPIKIEPQSLEDPEIAVASEKKSTNSLNISTLSAFVIKVKAEPSEEAEAKFVQEKNVGKLPEVSHLIHPVICSSTVHFCLPKSNIQEKLIPHFSISKEGRPTYCNSSDQIRVTEKVLLPSAELSTMMSSLDELISETTGLINPHPLKDADLYDCPLLSNGNSQGVTYNECFDQLSYPQLNFNAGEAQHDSFSSSSPKVKLESVESNLLKCWPIPSCNTKELDIMLSKHPSDFPSDILDHVPLKYRMGIPFSQGDANMNTRNISEETAPETSGCGSFGSRNAKASLFSRRRRRKKTATNLLEKALEEDAPGLLQILLDRGILVEEIKLYGDMEDNDPLEIYSSEDSFEELETVMTKLFSERSSLLRFSFGRAVKESRAVYCLACLISLIEQTRYLHFRRTPVEWGWCRDLQSFIFVFQTHNRIVLERPEYGYATYFFELVESLPVDWQIKRLVTAMKLANCSRTILLENKPLVVGVDLTEGEARVMEAYGWTPNTGFGTMLNFCDRVVHDRRNEMYSSEWRSKIGKLLMNGYDGGRMVLTNIPMKAVAYMGSHSPEVKLEQSEHLSPANVDTVLQ